MTEIAILKYYLNSISILVDNHLTTSTTKTLLEPNLRTTSNGSPFEKLEKFRTKMANFHNKIKSN